MILGKYVETGVHVLLRRVIGSCGRRVFVVDVGAAVGEIVIDAAGYHNVEEVVAIDPDDANLAAIAGSARINGYTHIRLIRAVVSDADRLVTFVYNRSRGKSGRIDAQAEKDGELVRAVTIDGLGLGQRSDAVTVMVIDVEGAELHVIRGGKRFIADNMPLIVFEYNRTTRRAFQLEELRRELPYGYRIYRLRADGDLDDNLQDTWNCVAVPATLGHLKLRERVVTGE
jgi:FkbM family methyltransferase